MTAIAPLEIFDSFDRSQSGIGTTDSGHTWSTSYKHSSLSPSVNGSRLQLYQKKDAALWFSPVPITNVGAQNEREVLVKVKHSTTSAFSYGPMLNYSPSTGAYYVARFQPNSLQVCVHDRKGNFFIITQTTWTTPSSSTWFWVRFRQDASDNKLKVKTWNEGNAEPAGWTFTSPLFDGSYPPDGGVPGFWTQSRDTTSFSVYLAKFYSYNLDPDAEAGLPVTDDYQRNVASKGWGLADTQQLWRGHVADDPAILTSGFSAYTIWDANGSRAALDTAAAGNYYAYVGPTQKDTEHLAAFSINNTGASFYVGVRGSFTLAGNDISDYNGYLCRVTQGSTSVALAYSLGGSVPTLATGTLGSAIAADTIYWVRFKVVGTALSARVWQDGTSEPATWLVTATDSHIGSVGQGFYRFNAATATNFRVWSTSIDVGQVDAPTASNYVTTGTLTATATDTLASVTATYSNDDNNSATATIQYRLVGTPTWSTATATKVTASHKYTASFAVLPGQTYDVKVTHSDSDGVRGKNPVTTTVTAKYDGIHIHDLSIVPAVYQAVVSLPYDGDNNNNATATFAYRLSPSGTWSSEGAMTFDRVARTISFTKTGLAADTTYEGRVTVSDSSTFSPTTLSATFTTTGKEVHVLGVGATPSSHSAVVVASYEYDVNDNCDCVFQYRSIRDRIYTTVNASNVTVDRASKQFRITLAGLSADMSYEVRVTFSDPDGFGGNPSVAVTQFTTLGTVFDPDKRGKYHIYRVYDRDDNFVGTWPEADDPDFTWDQNGGVNTLNVKLWRTLQQLNDDPTVNFRNRVDVWAVDGESNGMGPNLLSDGDMDLGAWTLATSWSAPSSGGADGGACLKFSSATATQRMIFSETVNLARIVPLHVTAMAQARGGKLRLDMAAYDTLGNELAVCPDNAETVGVEWQRLDLEWLPPANTSYVRVRVENVGAGTMLLDKVTCLIKEMLIYRGYIEGYTPTITEQGEYVDVEVLGLASTLSDDYIDFLQYTDIQPTRDLSSPDRKNKNRPPADPAQMLRDVIDIAQDQNPGFRLYYTTDSIKPTGVVASYTFRDKLIRDCFDKVRTLCPADWYYVIDPDGKVWLLGPEHAATHKLRLNVEIIEYKNERSIHDLKNVVIFHGRQDDDGSEPDGFGSINATALDQGSIDQYGRRVVVLRDSNVKDPTTAEIMAEGRLAEYNVVEQAGEATVPDEKDLRPSLSESGALRGYNVQAFRPGDMVTVLDPTTGPNHTFWDQFDWDSGATWDSTTVRALPETAVPIKTVAYHGDNVVISLAHRQPTARSDIARMQAVLRRQAEDEGINN